MAFLNPYASQLPFLPSIAFLLHQMEPNNQYFVRITRGKGIDQTQQNYSTVKLKYFVFLVCVFLLFVSLL